MTAISPSQWATAFVVAIAAHLLAAALIWAFDNAPDAPAHSPRGVMVSLDALSVGNTSQPVATPAPVQPVPASPSTPTNATTPTGITPAQSVPATAQAPEPVKPEPVKPATSDSTGHIPAAGGIDIPVADTVTVNRKDTPEKIDRPAPVTPDPRRTTRSANPGSGASGLSSDPTVTYIARVRSWLGQHKYYPLGARRSGIHGTVRLYLVIASSGEILNLAVARSSGYAVLDQAAMGMVKRAEPLPAMPDDMLRTRIAIILPVHYDLSSRTQPPAR